MFTDKAAARKVLDMTNQITNAMNESLFEVRDMRPEPEFNEYRLAIGHVMAEIYIQIRMPIYAAFPDLEPEAEKS